VNLKILAGIIVRRTRSIIAARYTIPALIQDLNRNLQGWAAYFSFGYPSEAYRTKEASLSDEEQHHMIECDECLSLSGLCQICNSLSQVQRRLKEQQA